MTYEQAWELAKKTEWKVQSCFSGKKCWCKMIVPVKPIKYKELHSTIPQKIVIVSAGAIDTPTAQHIVNVHNAFVHVVNGFDKL